MKKIICAITPNPALDLSGTVRGLRPNEKAYIDEEIRAPGGNAINAARILTRLKVPVISCGFLGGSTGDDLLSLIEKEKVLSHFIRVQGDTRINVTVSDRATLQQTRLSFPGPQIHRQEKKELFDFFAKKKNISFLLIGGSLPKGFTANDIVHLMKLAKKRDIPCVVDCPGLVMAKIIPAGPLLIKPNLEEFQELTGSKVKSIAAVIKAAQRFLKYVTYVCVSSVEGGTVLITREGNYFGHIPRIKIQSTVGAGDSMVGAMMAQLYKGETSPEEILRWGLAASAATLSERGTRLGHAKAIHALYKKTRVISKI